MSLDESNDKEWLDRLTAFPPAPVPTDPRVTFYQMGYAKGLAQTNKPVNGRAITLSHLVAAAAVVGITATAFLAGRRTHSQPLDLSVVAQQSTVAHQSTVANEASKPLAESPSPLSSKPSLSMASAGATDHQSRTGKLVLGSQDFWSGREISVYGAAGLALPGNADVTDVHTLASTLTRGDYLNWENQQ